MSFMNPVWISVGNGKRTCSNCGKEIDKVPVVYEFIDEAYGGWKYKRAVIIPNCCEQCGEYFDYVLYLDAECPE